MDILEWPLVTLSLADDQTLFTFTNMAALLDKFSQSYIDSRFNQFLQYYEQNNSFNHFISIKNNHCHLLNEYHHPGEYRKLELREGSLRCTLRAHQFIYYIFTGVFAKSGEDISHLCSNKSCVNFEHLTVEPHKVNTQRRKCVDNRRCSGHVDFKNCILF